MFDRELLNIPGMFRVVILCVIFALLRGLLVVGQCFFLASAIVQVWQGSGISSVFWLVGCFFICFVGRRVVSMAEERFMEAYSCARAREMRLDIMSQLWDTSVEMVSKFGTAAISKMIASDIDAISRMIRIVVPKTVSVIVIPLTVAIAIYTQDWISGLIVTICYPFIIVFMRLIGHTASDEAARRLKGFSAMAGNFLDALRGLGTLRAFRISRAYADNVYAVSEAYRKRVMKTLTIATLSSTVLDIFATLGLAGVAIMLGFRMVEGSIAFLPALISLMLVPEFFMPVRAYASDYHDTLDGKSAYAKLREMMDCKCRNIVISSGGISVDKGTKVALVGRSGSGKSSLLSAMAGACETCGGALEVAGETPAASDSWACHVAYIPQSPHLIDGTLRENVSFYEPSATDEAIERALFDVGLGDLLESLPQGLDERLGEFGRTISAGQAQRIHVARALVSRERDIWLLDEPSSNLDRWSDEELKRAVFANVGNRTLVVATHRLHWTSSTDEVIDMGTLANSFSGETRVSL